MELNILPDNDDSKRKMQELLISAGAMGAGFLLNKLMESGYKGLYHEDAPSKIDARKVNWMKLAGWTVVSGIAVTGLKVLIRRYAGKAIDD
ncbi:MAG TPA: hypothetical protein DCG19_12185 [Cryomorphaceae bacterium]|nr:hypothetical protein [Owenweeksia sp.]MBF98683.1 hypothetical protein [Owenweeksia sp.]HAD98159.1 hypothetical protein [Cryomorphaceae bacterium]HBF19570.1 hypothetical protein [Cryomorphaceae bacterium]HCQ15856.1 hypothetical protein [Cryomorphaceae bacterium]|tara:strand:+ start:192 stop:464 length:273 start_codon:yes stop_codon:yes gene_type:complete